MQIQSVKKKDDHSNSNERVCVYAGGCVRDREALLDSVPPWQHSLWARHRRQRKEGDSEDRGGREGGRERGEEQDVSIRLGVSRHREKRGEDKTVQWRENCIRLGD